MPESERELMEIGGRVLSLTNLDKVLWPDKSITKAHLIKYYMEMAPFILPLIYNRPLVMKRYPHGITEDAFYQKECPAYAPDWVETFPVSHTNKVINYIVCNDIATLVWLANQGCLEVHAWLSRVDDIDYPDLAVFDLDPAEGVDFVKVLEVAVLVREMLKEFGVFGFPKTSGSKGLHIFIPLENKYTFAEVTAAMKFMADIVARAYPGGVTIERSIPRRKNKVYLDFLQNGRGKTMAFPYSLRPRPGATVSAPLTWAEIEGKKVRPEQFDIFNIIKRTRDMGDLYRGIFNQKSSLDKVFQYSAPAAGYAGTVDLMDN